MSVRVTERSFGFFEGKEVKKFLITQVAGIQVGVINYGATITNIIVPDRKGVPADIVLGFETLDGYINAGDIYMGGICGRYANRIARSSFSIGDETFAIFQNEQENTLHGGKKGFDKVYWEAEILPDANGVAFTYLSKDGEQGFPGNLKVTVTYSIYDNRLEIEYNGVTDKATPVNLTSHCYFNLSGDEDKDIKEHDLSLNAGSIVEVDDEVIPTGNLLDVSNSSMDFRQMRKLNNGMLNGYDQTWVLKNDENDLTEATKLFHRKSGREMTVFTTKPGIHFYNGHHLKGNYEATKKGKDYVQYAGLCLEAQYFPDSPNHKNFPNTILRPGENYHQKTIYSFSHLNKN